MILRDLLTNWQESDLCRVWHSQTPPWFTWAQKRGWAVEASPARALPCSECLTVHPIQFIRDEKGQLVTYVCCDQCGVERVLESHLQMWRWDHSKIVSDLAHLFALEFHPEVLVAQHAWILGRISLANSRPQLVLIRNQDAVRDEIFQEWLRRNKSVVGLFLRNIDAMNWNLASLILTDEIVIKKEKLQLRNDWLSAINGSSLSSGNEYKKPRQRRNERTAKIERVSNYLLEFLRQRGELANSGFQLKLDYKVMAKPSQRKIAKDTGLEEYEVSRCLNDPKAKQLQKIWQVCCSLDIGETHRMISEFRRRSRPKLEEYD